MCPVISTLDLELDVGRRVVALVGREGRELVPPPQKLRHLLEEFL
jgi:hypothetical protein